MSKRSQVEVHIIVFDNRARFPEQNIEPSKGMELINDLVDQLDAKYTYYSDNGVEFRTNFKR